MVGVVDAGVLRLEEVHRFANTPVRLLDTLHWDVLGLYSGMLEGLRAAVHQNAPLTSVGIDGWAVDYGLLDERGKLLGNPVHYRDTRTNAVFRATIDRLGAESIYGTTGVQFLPLNTLYQLVAEQESGRLRHAKQLLLVPDLLTYWLTGVAATEVTNASTTQFFDATSRTWNGDLLSRAGVDPAILTTLREPRENVGPLLADVAEHVGDAALTVITVCSHDTASAVVAVPARTPHFAYISCGTWSLVGVELDDAILTPESCAAGFTNELGIDGTIRYLRNVMGLWVLLECLRTWNMPTRGAVLERLLIEAATVLPARSVVDINDARFLPPGDMPGRIAAICAERGEPVPVTRAETVRCVLDSLAVAYRAAVRDAQRLSDRAVDVVHMVGGGSLNTVLCQLTSDACALPVVAGPVEAAALGNVLVQAQAHGVISTGLQEARTLVHATHNVRTYTPQGRDAMWADAARRALG